MSFVIGAPSRNTVCTYVSNSSPISLFRSFVYGRYAWDNVSAIYDFRDLIWRSYALRSRDFAVLMGIIVSTKRPACRCYINALVRGTMLFVIYAQEMELIKVLWRGGGYFSLSSIAVSKTQWGDWISQVLGLSMVKTNTGLLWPALPMPFYILHTSTYSMETLHNAPIFHGIILNSTCKLDFYGVCMWWCLHAW
jgi:hypothetical protein